MQILKSKYMLAGFMVFFILGMINCSTSRTVALDPVSADFYETARLVMTNEEKDIFNHLPDSLSRSEFIQDFWNKRDPDPETEENEFKDEFFSRIEYANQRFNEGTPGWKTDRGRIFIYLGPPDKRDEIFTSPTGQPMRGSSLWWVYYRYEFAVMFVDNSGLGHYTLDPYAGVYGDLFLAIEKAKMGIGFKDDNFGSKFWNFSLEYDKAQQEFIIEIPAETLVFLEEGEKLKAEFEFDFYIYSEGSPKQKFSEARSFETTEEKILKMEKIKFKFPYLLAPGKYNVDVKIFGKPDIGLSRRIFKIKL